jgi:hypothetical protein
VNEFNNWLIVWLGAFGYVVKDRKWTQTPSSAHPYFLTTANQPLEFLSNTFFKMGSVRLREVNADEGLLDDDLQDSK